MNWKERVGSLPIIGYLAHWIVDMVTLPLIRADVSRALNTLAPRIDEIERELGRLRHSIGELQKEFGSVRNSTDQLRDQRSSDDRQFQEVTNAMTNVAEQARALYDRISKYS
jgi:chromosome segregation ATPase